MFKEILRNYLIYKGISQDDLASLLNVTQQAVSDFLTKGGNPQKKTREMYFEKVDGFLEYYNDKTSNKQVNRKSKSIIIEQSNAIVSTNKGVPYYDVDFVGGFDMVLNDQTLNPNFYIDFKPFNDADLWINITGKSMSPFISHGDIVALKKIESWKDFLLFGEIYALVTDEFRTIKIVGKGIDKDHLTLIPYNKGKEFSEQQIPARLINHLFRVKGSIKKFF
jgi:predicted transcriptional regulator